jgi:hypothetical protein
MPVYYFREVQNETKVRRNTAIEYICFFIYSLWFPVKHCSSGAFTERTNLLLQSYSLYKFEDVCKIFRTGRLERELQMIQLSATRCSCIAIMWVSLVSFAAITLCVASQRVFIVAVVIYFVTTQSGNFWIRTAYHAAKSQKLLSLHFVEYPSY